MVNTLVIEDVASIPGVHTSIYSGKERAIMVEYNNQIINIINIVMACTIMIIPIDLYHTLILFFFKHREVK